MMQRLASEARVCKRCGVESFDGAARCAGCGGPVTTARTMRVLGWLLVGLGSFLFLFMGVITYFVAGIMLRADDGGAGSHFRGTPEMALAIFALFGVVMLFGVAAIISGVWQVHYGRANRKLMIFVIALGVLFIIAGRLVHLVVH